MSLRVLLGSTGGTALKAIVMRMVSGWEHCGEASVVLGGGKGEIRWERRKRISIVNTGALMG